MTVDETIMMAGLARGLVKTCYEQALSHTPYTTARSEVLRAAHWCAARWGLDSELVDIATERSIPARQLIDQFLDFVRPVLEEIGEWDEIYSIAQKTMQRGISAARQRDVYKMTHSLKAVVDFVVQETLNCC